ncbi:hypothetical protein BST61_g38 [Cercospora zeina]
MRSAAASQLREEAAHKAFRRTIVTQCMGFGGVGIALPIAKDVASSKLSEGPLDWFMPSSLSGERARCAALGSEARP